ncbi:molybdopterin molybdotransferase MoeA [Aeromicrobium sp. YIM 150415]|uniref:molybdotransferase-like divisome protein Glp n=1 Tax=Aeromicrobium sp. YIM 150415 TaxID=2803912 RepID=UPI001965AA2F|nr:gephyrin-like molybdotransferase Glp [Aeromicrobium sp. YIM 150415]MBM9461999.1 molybdopterin molybdotransferase MoeA [Aeromicrobium sp. YIM 150415]
MTAGESTSGAPTAASGGSGLPPRPRPHSIAPGRLTVEDHLETILRGIGPLGAYDQPVVESLGLSLHEEIVSDLDLPRHDSADIDGYAVAAQDLTGASTTGPVELPVVGEIVSGSGKPFAISSGTCVTIMTGAPLPHGADAVVPVEHVRGDHARVGFTRPATPGQNVRRQGEDVQAGTLVLPEGSVLGPREIGLLASVGRSRIKARPRPRVVIISTGRELREPGEHLGHDSVYDGNSSMIAAAVRAAGAIAFRVGAVGDDPRQFQRVLSDQLVRADLVITTGGLGHSRRDVVRQVLGNVGTVQFHDVALEPGHDQGFGRVLDEETPLIALPGDPVSAFVSFEVFALPALRRLMGRTPYRRPQVHAVLAEDIASEPGQREYVRGVFEVTHRGAKVTPVKGRGAHLIGHLAQANALIVVGEDETALNLGDTVRTIVLDRSF